MASPEEIANLQERLTIHRRNLATLLKQHALSGEMHAPLTITNGINEARSKIQQIKQILRGWQVPAPDSPDDGDAPLSFAPQVQLSPGAAAVVARTPLPPLALGQPLLCYASRDGAAQALSLYSAMQQAGLRPWLDQRDTPADYDPEAAREEALRECACLLLLTPASAAVQSEATHEWRPAPPTRPPANSRLMLSPSL